MGFVCWRTLRFQGRFIFLTGHTSKDWILVVNGIWDWIMYMKYRHNLRYVVYFWLSTCLCTCLNVQDWNFRTLTFEPVTYWSKYWSYTCNNDEIYWSTCSNNFRYKALSWIILLTDNTFLIRSKSGLIVGRQCLLLTINFYGLCNYGYQYVTMDMKQKLS